LTTDYPPLFLASGDKSRGILGSGVGLAQAAPAAKPAKSPKPAAFGLEPSLFKRFRALKRLAR